MDDEKAKEIIERMEKHCDSGLDYSDLIAEALEVIEFLKEDKHA